MSINLEIHCEEEVKVDSRGVHGNNIEATTLPNGTLVIAPPRTNMQTYRSDPEDEETSIVAYGPWARNERDADYGTESGKSCTIPLDAKIGNVEVQGLGSVAFSDDVFAPGHHEVVVGGECSVGLSDAELDSLTCRVYNKSYVCHVRMRKGDLAVHQKASIGDVYVYEEAVLSPNDGGTISLKCPREAADKIEVRHSDFQNKPGSK